jgi:hypothetical protein
MKTGIYSRKEFNTILFGYVFCSGLLEISDLIQGEEKFTLYKT